MKDPNLMTDEELDAEIESLVKWLFPSEEEMKKYQRKIGNKTYFSPPITHHYQCMDLLTLSLEKAIRDQKNE